MYAGMPYQAFTLFRTLETGIQINQSEVETVVNLFCNTREHLKLLSVYINQIHDEAVYQ